MGKQIEMCKGCSLRLRSTLCGLFGSDKVSDCPCRICLVKTMCRHMCVERMDFFTLVVKNKGL